MPATFIQFFEAKSDLKIITNRLIFSKSCLLYCTPLGVGRYIDIGCKIIPLDLELIMSSPRMDLEKRMDSITMGYLLSIIYLRDLHYSISFAP